MGLKVEKQHKKVYWKDLLLLLENRITLGKNQAAENSTVEYWFTTYKENYDLDLHIEIGISTVGKYKREIGSFQYRKIW